MENVHGIAVAGGSFPAEIWRRFMEQAARYSPPQDFPQPTTPPEFGYFKQGPWAFAGSTTDTTTSTTTTTATTDAQTTTAPTTTRAQTTTQRCRPRSRRPRRAPVDHRRRPRRRRPPSLRRRRTAADDHRADDHHRRPGSAVKCFASQPGRCGRRCSSPRSCSARSRCRAAASSAARSSATSTSTASTATHCSPGTSRTATSSSSTRRGRSPSSPAPSLAPGRRLRRDLQGADDAVLRRRDLLRLLRARSHRLPGVGVWTAATLPRAVADRARAGVAEHLRRLAGASSPSLRSPRSSPAEADSALALLGVAAAAKLYAVLLVPVAVVWLWRERGRRVALAGARRLRRRRRPCSSCRGSRSRPGGVWDSFHSQVGRGLHTESLGAGFLLVADRLGWYHAHVVAPRRRSRATSPASLPRGDRRGERRARRPGRARAGGRAAVAARPRRGSRSRRASPGFSRSPRCSRRSTSSG